MVAPIVASYALYFWNVRPSSVNYGELLEVKPLAGTALNQSDNTIFRMRQLRGKWALISVDSGKCDEAVPQEALLHASGASDTKHGKGTHRAGMADR